MYWCLYVLRNRTLRRTAQYSYELDFLVWVWVWVWVWGARVIGIVIVISRIVVVAHSTDTGADEAFFEGGIHAEYDGSRTCSMERREETDDVRYEAQAQAQFWSGDRQWMDGWMDGLSVHNRNHLCDLTQDTTGQLEHQDTTPPQRIGCCTKWLWLLWCSAWHVLCVCCVCAAYGEVQQIIHSAAFNGQLDPEDGLVFVQYSVVCSPA